MKVCALIVTYGDRFHLLEQVINACYEEGIDKVIVVDNASIESSKKQLKEYEKDNKDRLQIIYLNENTGSAGGYKRGLEEAYKSNECEFIWLLDDDNKPKNNALNELVNFWNNITYIQEKEENLALLSYRSDRIVYKEAVIRNNPNYILGRKNSFLGFHILDIPQKVFKLIKKKFFSNTLSDEKVDFGTVSVAPYGGIFFHKELIETIGLPNEDYFVYADDYDWSYRIPNIYLTFKSEIEDIDTSWNLKEKKVSPFYSYLNEGNNFRVYYSIRNRVHFEKQLITKKPIYRINKFVFEKILFLYKNYKNTDRLKLYNSAVKDGILGNLGMTFKEEVKK